MKKLSLRERYLLESDPEQRKEITEVIEKRRDTYTVFVQNLICVLLGISLAYVNALVFAGFLSGPLESAFRLFFPKLMVSVEFVSGFFDMLFKMGFMGAVISIAATSGIMKFKLSHADTEYNKSCMSFVYRCTRVIMPMMFFLPFIESILEISFSGSWALIGITLAVLIANAICARFKSYTAEEKDYLNLTQGLALPRAILGLVFYFIILFLTVIFGELIPISYDAFLRGGSNKLYTVMSILLIVGVVGVLLYTFDNLARLACVYDKRFGRYRNLLLSVANLLFVCVPLFWLELDIWQILVLAVCPLLMLILEIVTFTLEGKAHSALTREDMQEVVSGKPVEVLPQELLIKYRPFSNAKKAKTISTK